MAGRRKRKSSEAVSQEPRPVEEGKIKLAINSWEDVADSAEEFEISRDKILLEEEPARKRQRRLQEEYDVLLPSDEEVLELPSDDDEQSSDAEDNVEDPSNDDSSIGAPEKDDETEEGWGSSRRDYYNADNIETEADALEEEEEALRLQQKQLEDMTEADFGFDEAEWQVNDEGIEDGENADAALQETLPQVGVTDDMSAEERTRMLTSRYPEFDALAKEFVYLEDEYNELSAKAEAYRNHVYSDSTIPGSILKWRALGAYLGVLSMYFVLLTSGSVDDSGKHTTMKPQDFRRHPIIQTLVQAKAQWEQVKKLSLSDPEVADRRTTGEAVISIPEILDRSYGEVKKQAKRDANRTSKAEAKAMKVKQLAQAARTERLQRTKDDLARITASISQKPASSAKTNGVRADHDISDFGETAADAKSQDRRKKSLAFYTSQIASKSQKRSLASKGAGGDEDIPYKERFRDRVARLNAEAQARGHEAQDTFGDAPNDQDNQMAAQIRKQADEEDYYQTIASRTQSKKHSKALRAGAVKEAAAQGAAVREVEQVGPDGKRAITYAIEKNKGLTPKRKKEVRNPRLKKRLKYEEKMKKLGSMRQMYRGGEGKGGYQGEMTGIKSGIVRSRKL